MRASSLIRPPIDICPRGLIKRAKGPRDSLRHIAALGRKTNFDQFAYSQLLCKYTRSKPLQTIRSRDSSLRKMSDDAYSSFLDQANQDTGASKASTKSKAASTKAVDTDVPATLQKVDQYYTSESDEPFEPVSLKWKGNNMPSESMYP